MGDEQKIITATVAGRDVSLYEPTEDQIVAWMGIVGFLTDEDRDPENPEETREMVGDVTLFLDAMLGSFVEDKDRKAYRRAVVMGKATIADLFTALMPDVEQPSPKPKKNTGVRRA